jgi:hypothetical protein
MPVRYRAEYRSELDRRHKTWELGVHRDKAAALAALNEMSDRPSGTFSFDEPTDKPVAQGYVLIEWDDAQQLPRRTLRPLYLRKQA